MKVVTVIISDEPVTSKGGDLILWMPVSEQLLEDTTMTRSYLPTATAQHLQKLLYDYRFEGGRWVEEEK